MMEEKLFPLPAVAAELREKYVEARLHTDIADEALRSKFKALQLKLADSYANPIYVVIDPQTGANLGIQVGAEMDPKVFMAWLRITQLSSGDLSLPDLNLEEDF